VQVVVARGESPRVEVRVEGSRAGVDAALQRMGEVARGCGITGAASSRELMQRERLWEGMGPAEAVCKVTFLPARLAELCRVVSGAQGWVLVAQAPGVGWLRVGASNEDGLADTLSSLRREVVRLGGSLVILSATPAVKRRVEAWGEAGGALPLMRRVKERFDPARVLNDGRFVGGI
jgi:glycolate oxidase FAD binding subunit